MRKLFCIVNNIALDYQAPLCLAVVNILAYGLLIPWLGFYGDDWGYIWLLFKGPGLETFLGSSRVGFIPFYNALSLLIGPYPAAWLVYMLLIRWLNSLAFWLILHKLWPKDKRLTLMTGLLFAVYPGFYLNSAAVNISMFLLLLTFFFFSIYLHLLWEESRHKKWGLLVVSLILAIANIAMAEYFFFMEMIRPVILYLFFLPKEFSKNKRFFDTIKSWLPHLAGFLAVLIWRLLFQSKINAHYTIALLDDLRAAPLPTILAQLWRMINDLLLSGLVAWFRAVFPSDLLHLPNAPVKIFIAVLVVLTASFFVIQLFIHTKFRQEPINRQQALLWITLGLLWFMVSGWSIWLAKLEITHIFSTTRFTMPFMPGAALMITGLIILLPNQRIVQNFIFSLVFGSAIATQLLIANYFRMDWVKQESFYRQLTWRFPGLHSGSMVLISRNPLENGEENSISSAVNWIYSLGNEIGVDYYAYFNRDKFSFDLGEFKPGQQLTRPHLIGSFTADLNRSVALYLDARNCIRVLYPGLDDRNSRLSDFMRANIPYTRPDEVLQPANAETQRALRQVFGSEPEHDWCWLYQVADLSSRSGDWPAITTLADEYLHPDEYQNDWQKLLVFIEAYARQGEWEKAGKVFMNIGDLKPGERAVFCAVTRRWMDEINLDPGFEQLITDKRSNLNCTE
ncbi:MAG: hypothetical protein C0391_02475 [Anaerolinea sp.]|nr:hypothetical protein [Anaerolinea sp.]